MTLDEMVETWRAQDVTPLYGVNRDLLQLVLEHEESRMRRALRLEQWVTYGANTFFFGAMVFFFLLLCYGTDPRTTWPYYLAATVGASAALCGSIAMWVSRRRQALRERNFGNSLREELQRNLSLLEYALSRKGRAWRVFLITAPFTLAGPLIYFWLTMRINTLAFGAMEAVLVLTLVATGVWVAFEESRRIRKQLLPRLRRLSELLEMLDAGDGRSAG